MLQGVELFRFRADATKSAFPRLASSGEGITFSSKKHFELLSSNWLYKLVSSNLICPFWTDTPHIIPCRTAYDVLARPMHNYTLFGLRADQLGPCRLSRKSGVQMQITLEFERFHSGNNNKI